jgi:hypothetical protein
MDQSLNAGLGHCDRLGAHRGSRLNARTTSAATLKLLTCSIGLLGRRTPARRPTSVRNAVVSVGLALMDRVWIALMTSAVLLLFAVVGILILRPELIEATRVVRSSG